MKEDIMPDKIKNFLHSKIELAYKAGEKNILDEIMNGGYAMGGSLSSIKKGIRQQTLKQIEEWAEENKTSYWDEENIRLEDLKKFINTL